MKICNFSIDIKKNKSFKNEDPIRELLEKCFKKDDIEIGLKKVLDRKMERFYPIISGNPLPETEEETISTNNIIGYIGLTDIECFVIKPESNETDKISVEVFLLIHHSTFESGIEKATEEIKLKICRNSLTISSTIKTVKLYPVVNEDIYNTSFKIVAHYNTKEQHLKHWWPVYTEILVLLFSILLWQYTEIKPFAQGVTGSVFLAAILEFITCYKTWKNELNANFEDICDLDILTKGLFEAKTKPTPDDSSEE